ncbi:hypothetical protein CAEBREN_03718 [Caenorhabditis brenneri]|uniref:Uncharacterized protein n=1 Tax=Caenorhabditis brenneri TaxID=135651 RepID=G0MIS5_CAEBE|nr:hypothetical protein CAEBREN_03718 [Caenorhabditis brenneri]
MPCSLPTDSEVSDYSDDEPDDTNNPRPYDSDDEFYGADEMDRRATEDLFRRYINRPITPPRPVVRRQVGGDRNPAGLASRIISMVHDVNPEVPLMNADGHLNPDRDEYFDRYLEDMERRIASARNPLTIETHFPAPEHRPSGRPFMVVSRTVRPTPFESYDMSLGTFWRAPEAHRRPGEENGRPNEADPAEPYVSPYAGLIGGLRMPFLRDHRQQPSVALAQSSTGGTQIDQNEPRAGPNQPPANPAPGVRPLPAAIADDPYQMRFMVVQEPTDEENRTVPHVEQATGPNREARQPDPPPPNDHQRSSRFRYIMGRQYSRPTSDGLVIDTLPNGDRVRRNGSE